MANDITEGEVQAAERALQAAVTAVGAAEASVQAADASFKAEEARTAAYGSTSGSGGAYGPGTGQRNFERAREDARREWSGLEAMLARAEELLRRCGDAESKLRVAVSRTSSDLSKIVDSVVRAREEGAARGFRESAEKARGWKDRLQHAVDQARRAGSGASSLSPPSPAPFAAPSKAYSSGGPSGYASRPGTAYASPSYSSGAAPGYSTRPPLEERVTSTPFGFASRGMELPRGSRSEPGRTEGQTIPGPMPKSPPGPWNPDHWPEPPVPRPVAPFPAPSPSAAPFEYFPYDPARAVDMTIPLDDRLRAEVGLVLRLFGYSHALGYQGRYDA